MKRIAIVTPCFNEEENVEELYKQVKEIFADLPQYEYEHLFIDNASTDNTVTLLKTIAKNDKNVKIIRNSRNFGQVRSPYYALLQARGDAVILIVADLQDPTEMIPKFIQQWEEGHKIIVGVKPTAQESLLMLAIRKAYYHFITKISGVKLIKNFTGFGLYDKEIINILETLKEPQPYFRGLISDIGFEVIQIPYCQPRRKRGISKNNFFTLYDLAMLGITSHTKVPIRLATMSGFMLSFASFLLAIIYLILKIVFWNSFPMGIAPILIGIFFFASIQLFFIGLLGEYVLTIFTQVQNRPLVIEQERINF